MPVSTTTIVKNVSGKTLTFSFLPPFGKELADQEQYEFDGDVYSLLDNNPRAFRALKNALDTSLLNILQLPGGAPTWGAAVQAIADLRAIPPAQRFDKDVRLVEDAGTTYRFDQQDSTSIDDGDRVVAPDQGQGRWLKAEGVGVSTISNPKQTCRLSPDGVITSTGTPTYNNVGGPLSRGQLTQMPDAADGQTVAVDDRLLVQFEGLGGGLGGDANGIYVVTAVGTGGNGIWDRAADFDQDDEVTAGSYTFVAEGTVNGDKGYLLVTDNPITIGGVSGTVLLWTVFTGSVPAKDDRERTPVVTSGDGSTSGIAISRTPAANSDILLFVNGLEELIGDGVKTKAAYFSRDGGTTALTISNVQVSDTLFWNGVIATYELAVTDRIRLDYNVAA